MFTGNLDYFTIANINNIQNPDLIYPGDKIILNPSRPINTLRSYLENNYESNFNNAYHLMSAETRAWFSFTDFVKSLFPIIEYDIDSIRICSDLSVKGHHILQLEVQYYEDPAKWGFNLVREKYKWYIILFDKNPTHPQENGFLEWKCN